MAFNGSGVFTLVAGNPVVTGTTISSTWANNTLSDIATGLSTTITKDGQTTPTANIPMGGFKLTGLAAATLDGDALRFQDLATIAANTQTQTYTAFTTAGSSTAYTLTTVPAAAALVENQRYQVEWHTASGLAPTLARDGLTAKNILLYAPTGAKVTPPLGVLASGMKSDVVYDGTDYVVLDQLLPPVPQGYISGLTLSNNAGDPTNDMDIGSGMAADSTNLFLMSLTGPFTKRLDAAWAVGSGNGGLDTGSIANATYHVWLIRKDSDGTIDALFSTSMTAPTMPAGYTYKRRIGSIFRAAAAIRPMLQKGDLVLFKTPVLEVNDTALSTTATSYALTTVPPSCVALLNLYASRGAAQAAVWVYPPDITDIALSETAAPLGSLIVGAGGSSSAAGAAQAQILTNASSQIRAVAQSASTTLRVAVLGYIDTRGKDQ